MIRLTALAVLVVVLAVYAGRDWFVALCGLILMTALSEHPDMPHGMLGLPGLNPWNILLATILLVYVVKRRRSSTKAPRLIAWLFIGYLGLRVVGFLRALPDTEELAQLGVTQWKVYMDLLFNPLKYLLVGYMVYDGARTRRHVAIGVATVLLFCLVHSLLLYKSTKGMVFTGDFEDARRLTPKAIGLHPVDLGGMLTMGFWAWLVAATVLKGGWRWAALGAAVAIFPTFVGCYSRSAYVAFVLIGLVMGVARWRWLLAVGPVAAIVALAIFPRMGARATQDLIAGQRDANFEIEWNVVTAGRTKNIWEPVTEQISKSPIFGFGLMGIWRTECRHTILEREGVLVGHPHNSYLEVWLDSGLIGLVIVVAFLLALGASAFSLFGCRTDPLVALVGGVGFVGAVNVLALGLSSNFFYPKESVLWFICSAALVARLACSAPAPPHSLGAAGDVHGRVSDSPVGYAGAPTYPVRRSC